MVTSRRITCDTETKVQNYLNNRSSDRREHKYRWLDITIKEETQTQPLDVLIENRGMQFI